MVDRSPNSSEGDPVHDQPEELQRGHGQARPRWPGLPREPNIRAIIGRCTFSLAVVVGMARGALSRRPSNGALPMGHFPNWFLTPVPWAPRPLRNRIARWMALACLLAVGRAWGQERVTSPGTSSPLTGGEIQR